MNTIIIHCAATPNGKWFDAKDIHAWHKGRGWDGIGYHWVIRTDGSLEAGRPEYWMGSHAKGHNNSSIGICMIGTDEFSNEQWHALRTLVDELIVRYPGVKVIGHNEVSHKDCPGFNVQSWMGVK